MTINPMPTGPGTDTTAGAGLSWRDIADVDAARWDYRVAEARAAAVEADPAATDEQVWDASWAADGALDWLGALVQDRSQAAGATLGDWPAVVVSDVDTVLLPDDLLDGHTRPARSWYEQVRGITLDQDTGPTLASVPAPADGRDHAERWDTDDAIVIGQEPDELPDRADQNAAWWQAADTAEGARYDQAWRDLAIALDTGTPLTQAQAEDNALMNAYDLMYERMFDAADDDSDGLDDGT